MQGKLLLVTFYFNGGLHAVSIWKPSERMSNYWTVRFFKKTEQNRILVFRTSLIMISQQRMSVIKIKWV